MDPCGTLIEAVVAKWVASATLQNIIAGPFAEEKHTGSAGTFPYCAIKANARRTRTTNASEYFRVTFDFDVYHTTPESLRVSANLVLAVFDSDALAAALTMDEGHLLNQRLQESDPVQLDKTVWRHRLRYRFEVRRPRTA
jgi:hypothetical protein